MSEIFKHKIPSVRLGEFDLGGVLYHANYFHLYEQGREAFLESGPSSYPALVRDGYHLAVMESSQKFHAPIRYGDELILSITTRDLSRASVTFVYQIALGIAPENPVHTAWTKHALIRVEPNGFRVSPFSEELRELLTRYTDREC